jgi:hypothetical protein
MPEDPKLNPETPASPVPPEVKGTDEEMEQEAGDFITRQVLEKDAVFFEG